MNKKGFTLGETLVTVAIMGILGAVAFVSYGSFKQSARIRAMDEAAHTIFLAAEKSLTDAKAAGKVEYAEGDTVYVNINDTQKDDEEAELLVTNENISDELYNGNWLIRCEKSSSDAHVSEVFYSDNEDDTAFTEGYDYDTALELAGENSIGYYSGGDIKSSPASSSDDSSDGDVSCDYSVSNGEEFTVTAVCTVPKDLYSVTGGAVFSLELTDSSDNAGGYTF